MVQLKPSVKILPISAYKFQFHNGTIKTLIFSCFLLASVDFNSIMVQLKFSQSILPQNMRYADFNSNMVQLKLSKANLNKEVNSFQFQYGTIKTANQEATWHNQFHFNSNMVQLKRTYCLLIRTIPTISIPIWYN